MSFRRRIKNSISDFYRRQELDALKEDQQVESQPQRSQSEGNSISPISHQSSIRQDVDILLEQHRVFAHDPLKSADREIRLLQFLPSEKYGLTYCTVWHSSLDDPPPFTAVSYTWGESANEQAVIIDGATCYVRENCANALWQARLHHPSQLIWIDSICIDQRNTAEKSAQVALMGEIFGKASRVLVCVGEHEHNSNLIFESSASLFPPSIALGRLPESLMRLFRAFYDFKNRRCK